MQLNITQDKDQLLVCKTTQMNIKTILLSKKCRAQKKKM